MHRSHVVDYINRGNAPLMTVSHISGMNFLYCFFTYGFLVYAIVSRHVITTSILFAATVFHVILVAVLKRRVQELNFHQRFLISGFSTLFASVFFLLCSLIIAETVTSYGLGFRALLVLLWLVCVGLRLLIPWLRVRKGSYHNPPKKAAKQAVPLSIGLFMVAGLAGRLVARMIFPHLEQSVSVLVGIWLFFLMSVFCALGTSHLLKAYYIKRYDIEGESIPALIPGSVKHRSWPGKIFHTLLVLLGLAVAVAVLVGIYYSSATPG